jgi:hypothetical protein
MKFSRRLRLYLTGFLMGIILVFFFFGERVNVLTSWLPNNRVLQSISDNYQGERPQATCQMKCLGLDTAAVSFAMAEGDVQFGESETQSSPKLYVLEARYEDQRMKLEIELTDSSAFLSKVTLPFEERKDCDCP